MTSRERIQTAEPLPVVVARLDENVKHVVAEAKIIRAAVEEQGRTQASLPCESRGKRLSELQRTVNQLASNGIHANTRLELAWTAAKVAGAALIGLSGVLLGLWQALK